MKKVVSVLFLLMVLIVPQAYSLTAAIGNARAVINVEASPENPAIVDRTLKVINKNDIPVLIHLNPSVELRNYISLVDNDFVVQPGEEYLAKYILTIDRGGNIDGVINVLFSSADPEIKENEVGLSSRLVIISDGPIIDAPEAEEETETETEVPEEKEEEQEETVDTETESPDEEVEETETSTKPVITNKPSTSSKDGANPLVGVGIMALVIVLGLVVFVVVMKVLKK